jgi:mRNA-degrading endonuclease toxin of MazEF toxin-antitoxin module
VWLAYTPGQPADPHQPRCILIVSADVRNRAREHVMLVPIVSTGTLGPTRLPIPAAGPGLPITESWRLMHTASHPVVGGAGA